MKTYIVNIAPGYSITPHSLTDGRHQCQVKAENMAQAKVVVGARASTEKWPKSHAKIQEIGKRGERVGIPEYLDLP